MLSALPASRLRRFASLVRTLPEACGGLRGSRAVANPISSFFQFFLLFEAISCALAPCFAGSLRRTVHFQAPSSLAARLLSALPASRLRRFASLVRTLPEACGGLRGSRAVANPFFQFFLSVLSVLLFEAISCALALHFAVSAAYICYTWWHIHTYSYILYLYGSILIHTYTYVCSFCWSFFECAAATSVLQPVPQSLQSYSLFYSSQGCCTAHRWKRSWPAT